jgi:RNA polymerase sigma-70 factor, ECF subfamily
MDIAELYRAHQRQLVRLARRFLRDNALAEDAVHDGFISVIQHAGTFREGADPLPWLRRIVINAAKAIIRARSHSRTTSPVEGVPCREPEVLVVDVPCPAPEVYLADMPTVLSRLARLPKPQSEAIRLTYFGGTSMKVAATRLRVPAGTVKTRVHYGIKNLKAMLV